MSILESFICHIENGLLDGVSIERKAKIDVVSDYLDQAQILLESKDVHPAGPAVIIGASLEEFLRSWVEEANLPLNNKKPSIDSYTTTLREAELITKQDVKDITSWAGFRNNAAHGQWEEVADKKRVQLMLEGVNLFMRKYTDSVITTVPRPSKTNSSKSQRRSMPYPTSAMPPLLSRSLRHPGARNTPIGGMAKVRFSDSGWVND